MLASGLLISFPLVTFGLPGESRFHELIRGQAGRGPDAIALTAPDRTPLTYAALWAHAMRVAGGLRNIGLNPLDRVALVFPDGAEMATAFLGVAAAATAAPLNAVLRRPEIEAALADLRVKMLLTSEPEGSPAVAAARAGGIGVVPITPLRKLAAGLFSFDAATDAAPFDDRTPRGDAAALVLTTSGTTARSKIVALTHTNLSASALGIAASLRLNPNDRCLDLMPLFHVHGLIGGLLASLVSGGSVVCPSQFDAPRVFQWIDTFAPTWYTAAPAIHQAILTRAAAHRDVIARRRLRFIRSASAPLPDAVCLGLEAAFDAPVIEAYGMTEASHQIAANPLPPGVRKPGSVGVPSGTEAAIMNEHGEVLPPLTSGEIVIRGANVIRAYDGPAVANTFIDDWLRTGDAGYIDEEGYLFITGRLKEVINRGGEKINPKEVDEVLVSHPAVAQAATFALPHPSLGQDVAAAVVLRAGRTCSEQALREFVAAMLAPFKVPACIQFVDRLPTGPTGKVQRNQLAVQLGLDAAATARPPRPPHVAPDTPLERRLAGIWTSALGVGDVGLHDNFFELGGDSILAARVLGLVREEFNLEFSLVALFDRPVFRDMAGTIASSIANGPLDAGASTGEPSRPPAITPIARDAFRSSRVRSSPLQPGDPEVAR